MDLNGPLMKAMKALNFISGSSTDGEDIKKHRESVERVSRLATPKGDVDIEHFAVGEIKCESVKSLSNYNPHYVILYVHGGGYLSGGLDYARILAKKLAVATGFTTFTFAYRLAPEYAYPAAIEDGLSVWDHLTGGMYSPSHILLAGDSAGGNLALCLTQELLKKNRLTPRELLLFSPWTDMTCKAKSYETNKDIDPVLSREFVENAARAYIAGAGDPADSRFSPLFGNFAAFPPAYIMAGRNEILLDDSIRLCERIREAGRIAELDIEEKGWHVYQQMPVKIASLAINRLARHIEKELNGEK